MKKIKLELAKAAFGQKDLEDAALVIVVCADEMRAERSYGVRGKTVYCLQDTAAAVQNILLMACSLGLGSCWIGVFREDEVERVIGAPREMRPVALISVGYADEAPPARNRRPISEIMHKESF